MSEPKDAFSTRPFCATREEELDARLFGHIHFDDRFTGTILQGDTFERTTAYVVACLEFMLRHKDRIGISVDKWKRIESTLMHARQEFTVLKELEKKIHENRSAVLTFNNKEKKEKLSTQDLKWKYISPIATAALTQLKLTNTVLIPGGWAGIPGSSGHAMLYKITKEKDGSYTFMIFNTGAGIENHLKKSHVKDKYSPLMVFKIPDSKGIEDKLHLFLEELIAPQIKPFCNGVSDPEYEYGWSQEREYNEGRIYKEIIPKIFQLGAEPHDPEKYTRMSTQGQLAGTCAMRVLMPVLHVLMQGESETFQQFLNQFRLQSILDHFHIQKSKGKLNDKEFQKTILEAISKEARFVERLMYRSIDGHPAISKELVDQILKQFIPNIQKEFQAAQKVDVETKVTHDFPVKKLDTIFPTFAKITEKLLDTFEKETGEINKMALEKQTMPVLTDPRFYTSPLEFLKVSHSACLYYDTLGHSEATLHAIEQWCFSLPSDLKSATEYWKQLKPENVKEALSYLTLIQRTYGKCCARAGSYPFARQAINSQILKLSSGLILNQFFTFNSNLIQYDTSTSTPLPSDTYGTTFDPVYDKRAKQLEKFRLDWLQEKEKHRDLLAKEKEPRKKTIPRYQEFDLDFFEQLEYFDNINKNTVEELNIIQDNEDKMSILDNARINLYHLMRNPKLLEKASVNLKNVVNAYDTYLLHQQLNQESDLFLAHDHHSALDYFENINLTKDEPELRMNDKKISVLIPKDPKIITLGDYKTKHIFSRKGLSGKKTGNSLFNFLQTSGFTNHLLLSKELDSNQRLIEAIERNKLQDFNLSQSGTRTTPKLPVHALSFTRHLNDESRLLTTLDFFESNLELLEGVDCQRLLMLNLLTPHLLENRLKKDPLFSKTLLTFYDRCLNFYTKNNTLSSGGIACFELGYYLTKYLKNNLDIKGVAEVVEQFKEKNKKLEDYLKHYSKQKQLSQSYKDILNLYLLNRSLEPEKIIEPEALEFIFKALLIKELVSEATENKLLEYEKLSCITRFQPPLRTSFERLSSLQKYHLLRAIISDLLPDLEIKNFDDPAYFFKLNYPFVEVESSDNRIIKLDLSRGVITPKLGPIPLNIYKHYESILGGKPKQALIQYGKTSTTYEFYDKALDVSYQIIVYHDNPYSPTLLMKPSKETRWYAKGAAWDLLKGEIPRRYDYNNAHAWTSTETPPSYYYTDIHTHTPLAKIDFDRQGLGVREPKRDELYPYQLMELNTKGSATGYTLVPDKTPEVRSLKDFLTKFELDKNMIEIWQSSDPIRDPTPYKIRLSRYNLEWVAQKTGDGTLEYRWLDNPDFRLLLTDKEPIPGFSHCLYMENIKTKEQKCIVPKQQFYAEGGKSFEGHYYKLNYDLPKGWVGHRDGDIAVKDCQQRFIKEFPTVAVDITIPLHWETVGQERFSSYRVVNHRLEGKEPVDCLQLAYIALGRRDPITAMQALRACEKMGGLKGSLEEVQLINRIMTNIPSNVVNGSLYKDARIDDPETDAVRLYAAWLLSEQKRISFNKPFNFGLDEKKTWADEVHDFKKYKTANQYYSEKTKEETTDFYYQHFDVALNTAYRNYYQRIGNMDAALQLNPEKELSVLKVLIRNNPHSFSFQAREKELTALLLTKELHVLNKNLHMLSHKEQFLIENRSSKESKASEEMRSLKVLKIEKSKLEERVINIKKSLKQLHNVPKKVQSYLSRKGTLKPPPNNLHTHPLIAKAKELTFPEAHVCHLLESRLFTPKEFINSFNTLFNMSCERNPMLKKFIYQLLKTETLQPNIAFSDDTLMYSLVHLLAYVYEFPDAGFRGKETALNRLPELTRLCAELSTKAPKIDIIELHTRFIGETAVNSLEFTGEERDRKVGLDRKEDFDVPSKVPETLRWVPLEKPKISISNLAKNLDEVKLLQETDALLTQFKKDESSLKKKWEEVVHRSHPGDQDTFLFKQNKIFELDLAMGECFNKFRHNLNIIYHQHLHSHSKQEHIKSNLDKHIAAEKHDLKKIEQDILQLAKKNTVGPEIKPHIELQMIGKRYPLIDDVEIEKEGTYLPGLPKELLWLYLQGDLELFKKRTQLDSSHAIKLYQAIHDYLLRFSENQHRLRVSNILGSLLAARDKKEIYDSLMEQLGDALISNQCFDPETHTEMLLFECLDNKRIRVDQGKTLHRLTEKIITESGDISYRSEIEQKIMGSGKTILLMPLLALKKTTGQNLSILVMPTALFETNMNDISALTQRTFGKTGCPFIFNRETDCAPAHLKSMYEKLEEAMVNQDYVMTTADSLQSLQLKYLELLNKEGHTANDKERIGELEKLLILFKTKGDALIDECDTILDPKRELNYTQGQKQNVSPLIFKNILKIYRLLDKVSLGSDKEKYTLKQVMLGVKGIATEEAWTAALGSLAKKLIEDEEGLLHQVAHPFTHEQKEILLNYILNEKLSEIPPFILNNPNRDIIGLAKGELELFRHCLKNKYNEHYGFATSTDFSGSREVAIPYLSSNTPNERSEFGSVYEIINYTIEAQKQKDRLSLPIIYQFIADAKAEAMYEIVGSLGQVSIDHTKAGLAFEKLTHTKLSTLDLNDQKQLQELQKVYSENELIHDTLLQKYILPNIKQYSSVLRSNGINVIDQCRSTQGFSGTPWNVHCYHPRFYFNEEENLGIDGKTIELLIRKKPNIKTITASDTQKIIKETVVEHPETDQIHAFIDVGALFKGKDNETIAQEFSHHLATRPKNQVRHVLYFNEDNVLCAIPVEEGLEKPLSPKEHADLKHTKDIRDIGEIKDLKEKVESSHLKKSKPIIIGSTTTEVIYQKTGSRPEQCFTYYDQRHTTGTDIEQHFQAIGIETINDDTKIRDVVQGGMRMRQFPRKQRIDLILSQTAVSNTPKDHAWNIKDVVQLTQTNQLRTLADLHLRSYLDKMSHIVRQNCLDKILSCDNIELKIKLRKAFAKVFEISLQADPFHEFKDLKTLIDTEKIINQHSQSCLDHFKELLANAGLPLIPEEFNTITKALSTLHTQAMAYCKNQYKYVSHANEDRIVEVQKEKQKDIQKEILKEAQREKQTEKETQHLYANVKPNPIPHIPWGSEFPKTLNKESIQSDTTSHYFDLKLEKDRKTESEPHNIPVAHNVKIFSLNDMMATSKHKTVQFSDSIFVSENYFNTYRDQSNKMDSYLKPVNFMLLLKEPNTETLKALLITHEEAKEFSHYIDNHKELLQKNGYQAWIMTPHDRWLNGTSRTVDHNEYRSLQEQICFFNGDIDRLAQEKMMDWVFIDPKEKLNVLENVILPNHPEKRKFLDTFKDAFSNVQVKLLKDITKIDLNPMKAAIKASDPKALYEALKLFKQSLKKISNPGMCSQVLSKTLPGEPCSLLGLAIQSQDPNIVKILLNEHGLLPKLNFTPTDSPLMEALKHYQPDVFHLISLDDRVYPKQDDAEGWSKLLHDTLQAAEDKPVSVIFHQADKRCSPHIFADIINTLLKRALNSPDIVKTLSRLESVYDVPSGRRYAWHHYLQALSDRRPPFSDLIKIIQNFDLPPPPEINEKVAEKKARSDYFENLNKRLLKNESVALILKNKNTVTDEIQSLITHFKKEFEEYEHRFNKEYNEKFGVRDKLAGKTVWKDFIRLSHDEALKNPSMRKKLIEVIDQWQKRPPNRLMEEYFKNRCSYDPPTLLYDTFMKDKELFFQLITDKRFAIDPRDSGSWIILLEMSSHHPDSFSNIVEIINRALPTLSSEDRNKFLDNPLLAHTFNTVLTSYHNEKVLTLLSFMKIYPRDSHVQIWNQIISQFSKDPKLYSSLKMQEKLTDFFNVTVRSLPFCKSKSDLSEKLQTLAEIVDAFLKTDKVFLATKLVQTLDFKNPEIMLMGQGLLKEATRVEQWDLVETLMTYNIPAKDPKILNDILTWAVKHQKYAIVSTVLKQNAEVNTTIDAEDLDPIEFRHYQKGYGRVNIPILFWSINHRDSAMIKILIAAGADLTQHKYLHKSALETILALPPFNVAEILTSLDPASIKLFHDNPEILKIIFEWASQCEHDKKMNESKLKVLEWVLKAQDIEALRQPGNYYLRGMCLSFDEALRKKDGPHISVLLRVLGDTETHAVEKHNSNIQRYAEEAAQNNKAATINAVNLLSRNALYSRSESIMPIYLKACQHNAIGVVQTLFKDNAVMETLLTKNPEILKNAIEKNDLPLKKILLEAYQTYKRNKPYNPIPMSSNTLSMAIKAQDLETVTKLTELFNLKYNDSDLNELLNNGNITILEILLRTKEEKQLALQKSTQLKDSIKFDFFEDLGGMEALDEHGNPIPQKPKTEEEKKQAEAQIVCLHKIIEWLKSQGIQLPPPESPFLDVGEVVEDDTILPSPAPTFPSFLPRFRTSADSSLTIHPKDKDYADKPSSEVPLSSPTPDSLKLDEDEDNSKKSKPPSQST